MSETTVSVCDLAQAAAYGTDQALVGSAFVEGAKARRALSDEREQEFVRQAFRGLWDRNQTRIAQIPYPDSIKTLVEIEFDRIRQVIDSAPSDFFSMKSHECRSDLRILAFGRIPTGPEHLELDGLPRSVLWRGPLSQAWKFLKLLLQTRGVVPFYVVHLAYGLNPATFLFEYGKRAQKKMFLRIAECLRMHPHVRGVLAGSWWHDPQLDVVAPHLNYLRKGWTDNGAELFFWGPMPDTDDAPIRNSPARRELFEKGEYKPMSYLVVWPRKSLLAWADQQS